MDRPLICRLLGMICLLLAAAMTLSLPWTLPWFGEVERFDGRAFAGLAASIGACLAVGGVFLLAGRGAKGRRLYRREAIAVVGLSWHLATVLGALPFWFSGTCHGRNASGEPEPMTVADGLFESASGFSGTGATVLDDLEAPDLRKDVLVYFCAVLLIFLVAWMTLVAIEPDATWTALGHSSREKLVDCASAVSPLPRRACGRRTRRRRPPSASGRAGFRSGR